jgi:hypothetical protein
MRNSRAGISALKQPAELKYVGKVSIDERLFHLFHASGVLGIGSEGNDTPDRWASVVQAERISSSGVRTPVIFDFSVLEYRWGDYLISFFLRLFQDGLAPAVVAIGETRAALESLNGLSLQLPLFSDLAELSNFDFEAWEYL